MAVVTKQESPILEFPETSVFNHERWIVGAHLFVAFSALFVGILLGPFQTFRRAPALQWEIPFFSYYYQALTLHGVLNALVFTTFFIVGISFFVTQRSLQRPLKSTAVSWLAFWTMALGMIFAGYGILSGQSSVLFTFYAPMIAHWTFYVGLTLVVVGSWVGAGNVFWTYAAWKKEHRDEKVPLAVFAVIANFVMWVTATVGVATEILTMLLPASLGLIDTLDPQVSRILFWFFGHPLVYFWLIPAYLSWYTMLPKQLGVRLFSDTMGRVAFLGIMIFSIPIGVHHLFSDPGVSEISKIYHSALTFVVAVPSLLTAFNIAATVERGGRKRGATTIIDWVFKQPWGNPVVVAQYMGMFLFIFGGITGMMNASFNLNVALHNTTWIVGHFHTTLAGAVFMTYVSITYWILPMLRGRKLFMPWLATTQAYLWFVGMVIFAGSMGRGGLAGGTRRTDLGAAGAYISEAVGYWMNWSAVAGSILLLSTILLFTVIIGTLFFSRKPYEDPAPIQTKAPTDEFAPALFEKWRVWVLVIIVSNLIMWGPVLLQAFDPVNGFWVRVVKTGFNVP